MDRNVKVTLVCLQDIAGHDYPLWFSTIFHRTEPNSELHATEQLDIDLFLQTSQW